MRLSFACQDGQAQCSPSWQGVEGFRYDCHCHFVEPLPDNAAGEAISLRRHIEECIKPWLSTNLSSLPKTPNAPKLRLLGAYEDDPQSKSDTHQTVRETLPAEWCSISKPWESRRDAMLEVLLKAQAFSFKPVVQIDSTDTQVLSQALNGRVYEKTQIEKKTYRVLDAFSVLVVRLEMWKTMSNNSARLPRPPPTAMSA
jgi:hypothetical protein